MGDCIFCMIASGELAATKVYEDDQVVAFKDIASQAPVHVLVVPKVHYVDISDSVPDAVLCRLFAVIPKIAEQLGVAEAGYRLIVNTGRNANQTVKHLHVHLLGGARMSHGMVDLEDA